MMITVFRGTYILLLSYNPCDVFDYFGVESMHGLSKTECMAHHNTPITCLLVFAGLARGPNTLNMVRIPRSFLIGATCFIAG